MQLTMSSRGNPDFRENPQDELSQALTIEVNSWQEASAARETCSASVTIQAAAIGATGRFIPGNNLRIQLDKTMISPLYKFERDNFCLPASVSMMNANNR